MIRRSDHHLTMHVGGGGAHFPGHLSSSCNLQDCQPQSLAYYSLRWADETSRWPIDHREDVLHDLPGSQCILYTLKESGNTTRCRRRDFRRGRSTNLKRTERTEALNLVHSCPLISLRALPLFPCSLRENLDEPPLNLGNSQAN